MSENERLQLDYYHSLVVYCQNLLLSLYADKVYTNLKSWVNGKIDISIAFIFFKQSVITHLFYLLLLLLLLYWSYSPTLFDSFYFSWAIIYYSPILLCIFNCGFFLKTPCYVSYLLLSKVFKKTLIYHYLVVQSKF